MSDEITICGKVTESDGEIVAVAVWRVEEFEPPTAIGGLYGSKKWDQRILRITEAPDPPAPRPNWAWAFLAWFVTCVVLGACLVKFGL